MNSAVEDQFDTFLMHTYIYTNTHIHIHTQTNKHTNTNGYILPLRLYNRPAPTETSTTPPVSNKPASDKHKQDPQGGQ